MITKPIKGVDRIPLNEVFVSIQGEGPFMGRNALFIRVAGCNLAGVCKSCDTDFTTNIIKSRNGILKDIIRYAENGGRLVVFTGGEPSIYSEFIDDIVRDFEFTQVYDMDWQIETNGIIKVGGDFISLGGVVVVSPKKGFEKYAVDNYAGREYAHFKIVVGADKDDYTFWDFDTGEEFIKKLIEEYNHDKRNIWLMPFGATEEELAVNRQRVWELAVKYGVNYSERLHVLVFGKSMKGV